ncbi:uncharacterized protein LMH87_008611 [Akanthomyces muscarius]|uniref:Uncharacterized protein n=1 Tax=Akanthomyces muscarius TaxID=2231603 RepID=A0A9W8QHL2_AKAMU|nr:uncharacterized protein LMH87_008611 [Akanthomyces muscarius]KAJ4158066.1 hypothetical protein LMH87_008611 [Akanthomyces muscarius]
MHKYIRQPHNSALKTFRSFALHVTTQRASDDRKTSELITTPRLQFPYQGLSGSYVRAQILFHSGRKKVGMTFVQWRSTAEVHLLEAQDARYLVGDVSHGAEGWISMLK